MLKAEKANAATMEPPRITSPSAGMPVQVVVGDLQRKSPWPAT